MKRLRKCGLLLTYCLLLCLLTRSGMPALYVYFLDVGQADCTLLRQGDDALLIDGGNVADGALISRVLCELQVDQLSYVICTHAHEDHAGGLSRVLAACEVENLLSSVYRSDNAAFASLQKQAELRQIPIQTVSAGQQFSLGRVRVTVLGPQELDEDVNNQSVVLRVDYGALSLLFTGDAEKSAERDLIKREMPLEADILHVGHHGSATSSCDAFLKAVMPDYAVISVGQDNAYNLPAPSVLDRLKNSGTQILRTDQQGSILALCTPHAADFRFIVFPDGLDGFEGVVGNASSLIYHTANCPYLPDEQNRVYLSSIQQAQNMGYSVHARCAAD